MAEQKCTVIALQHNTWDAEAKGPGEPLLRGDTIMLSAADVARYGTGVAPYDSPLAQRARKLRELAVPPAVQQVTPAGDGGGGLGDQQATELQLTNNLPELQALAEAEAKPATPDASGDGKLDKPAKNGSLVNWQAYAEQNGIARDELVDGDGAALLTRDELVARFE